MEPASSIISALGGNSAVAKIVGKARSSVWKWTQPREKGGTGGIIPFAHARSLLAVAQERGVPLSLDDFLPAHGEEGEAA